MTKELTDEERKAGERISDFRGLKIIKTPNKDNDDDERRANGAKE